MTNLKLVFPNHEYEDEWFSIINEIEKANEKMIPYALKKETNDYNEYLNKVNKYSKGINLPECRVPADIYFLVNNDDKRILGAIDIRYSLNDYLYNFGGNIGYGIRPTERRKGYATKMLELVLEICWEKGLDKILITCNKSNTGSARTIIKNGGILENEIMENDELVQRYWIKCSRS